MFNLAENFHCLVFSARIHFASLYELNPKMMMHLFYLFFCFSSTLADVQCPDKKSTCPDKMTCCKLPSQQWGCCPLDHAVCCTDGLHCCPEGMTCNLQEQTCDNQTQSIPWLRKLAAETREDDILCPDGKKTCPSGDTCCKMGQPLAWGCCQFPHAVCCEDHVHCCPHGSVCNGSKCSNFNMHLITSSRNFIQGLGELNVKCANNKYCADESTCCVMDNGHWGCCPFTNAVCCGDKKHCCPTGTQCDSNTGHCVNIFGTKIRKWLKKYKATFKSTIDCPDKQSKCPDDTTCCELASGGYGCCPFPKAECCEDKQHCCPHGTTCDVPHQRCNKGSVSLPLAGKINADGTDDITCPDHKSKCPEGTTCCPISDTQFGCCPLPKAVCCEDRSHCCPTGTTCDLEEQTCVSASGNRTPWFLKFKPI